MKGLVVLARSLARAGRRPSEILRSLIASGLPDGEVDRNQLVQWFSDAFCFSDGQAYPVFGWRPDGTGELTDSAIDELLARRIHRTRAEWDRAVSL